MGRPIDRSAAHARALTTARRISFTLAGAGALGALGGCIEPAPPPGELADPGLDDPHPDGGLVADMAWDAAWEADPDAAWDDDMRGADAVADAVGDALVEDPEPDAEPMADDALVDAEVWSETEPCPSPADDPEAWSACCEAKGWDWDLDPNCAAWGPPMPPRMVA